MIIRYTAGAHGSVDELDETTGAGPTSGPITALKAERCGYNGASAASVARALVTRRVRARGTVIRQAGMPRRDLETRHVAGGFMDKDLTERLLVG